MGPMLHDATWLKLADEYTALCVECMFQRAAERGVALTFADLLPCMFNIRPSRRNLSPTGSWYDLFLSRASEPLPDDLSPDDLSEWQELFARRDRRRASRLARDTQNER